MTASSLFGVANTVALLAWIALLLAPRHPRVNAIAAVAVPATLALMYMALIALRFRPGAGGFDSIEHVRQLFGDDWLLLAGWVHYLAFDLLVGGWEARDAARRGISPWPVRPCLVATFMFGPIGFVSWLLIRRVAPHGAREGALPTRS